MDWISGMIHRLARQHPFMPPKELKDHKSKFWLEMGGISNIEVRAAKVLAPEGKLILNFHINSENLGLLQEVVDQILCCLRDPYILEFEARIGKDVIDFEVINNRLPNERIIMNMITTAHNLLGCENSVSFSCFLSWVINKPQNL